MKGYRNLLVTADSSQRALREGLRVAEEEGCDLIIMGVKREPVFCAACLMATWFTGLPGAHPARS